MEEKLDPTIIPHLYALCLNRECPKADTCLRQLAERSIPSHIAFWQVVSPKHIAEMEKDCPYYRSNKKVRYARGFINILDNLPHKQMQAVSLNLIRFFNQRTYYRVRKGERPLSPAEQRAVLSILKQHGVDKPKEFDAYFEAYDW